MIEIWLIELAKGIGKLFINPVFYWAFLLVLIVGYRRIKRERQSFGSRVFDVFDEWKNTWIFSLATGLLISVVLLGIGVVFSYETLLVLIIVMILLSIGFRFTLLSASYTIGLSYLLLLFLPYLWEKQTYFEQELFTHTNFTGLAILLCLFLIAEFVLIRRLGRNETYPLIIQGKRGQWIGQHHLKKISLIPFFVLVPSGILTPIEPYWPMIGMGNGTYSLTLFPLLLGFDYKIISELPIAAAKRIGRNILRIAVLVILLTVGSYYVPWLSFAAVLVAISGRELINYNERVHNKKKPPYFYEENDGLKVLGVIPGTPAARLDILVGEKIIKINDIPVRTTEELYSALQNSGSFFKMDILDDRGEVRFIRSAFYEDDHYQLGLLFTKEPYRIKKSELKNDSE